MLITLQDDGVLYVYDSAEDAVRDIDASETEESFRAVFDDRGQGYTLRRKRWRRLFGFLGNGEAAGVVLAPRGAADRAALLKTIASARTIAPRAAVRKVGRLVDRLAEGNA
ncbi:MAG: hypothetical protein QNJ30_00415 [Kiloniellales bacterium]|nr:hypothetical protein [Kiloniellales bacterium]